MCTKPSDNKIIRIETVSEIEDIETFLNENVYNLYPAYRQIVLNNGYPEFIVFYRSGEIKLK